MILQKRCVSYTQTLFSMYDSLDENVEEGKLRFLAFGLILNGFTTWMYRILS